MANGDYLPIVCARCGHSIKWGEHILILDCKTDRIIQGYCRNCWSYYQDLMCGGDDKWV